MSSINYSEKIPNNVNLAEDRALQRAQTGTAADVPAAHKSELGLK